MKKLLQRYKIIFPSEHGSWPLTLTPFVIGAGVAGRFPLPVWLCLLAILALFLARQPISLWLRIRRGKARRADAPAAIFWSLLLSGIAALAGIGLLLSGRQAILWLAAPAVGVLALTLGLGAWLGPRRLSVELIGVVGLALAAPAAYVAATGTLDTTAWLVWGISALHSVISVLYVRLRVDATHRRLSPAGARMVVLAHLLSLGIVLGTAAGGWLPWLVALPIALLLVRAVYAAWRRPPLDNVKRFGFTEIGYSLAFAAIVIIAFLIAQR
ncbi:MAG TPA: hypothetical protein ENI95_02855 [Chloroflexi bacterium]|nr:hypothetical protein [Chloroflexota bacterium]